MLLLPTRRRDDEEIVVGVQRLCGKIDLRMTLDLQISTQANYVMPFCDSSFVCISSFFSARYQKHYVIIVAAKSSCLY
jgi:hypothetical protein